jgi:hypothetical protein
MRTAACPLALVCVLLLAPAPAGAQERASSKPRIEVEGDGTDLFRALLNAKGIRPVTRNELRRLPRYDDLIIITLGNHSASSTPRPPFDYVMRAVNSGGSALVASDTDSFLGTVTNQLNGEQVSAQIQRARVAARDKDLGLHGFADCPFVEPVNREVSAFAPRPGSRLDRLFNGDEDAGLKPLTRVATNGPSYIWVNGDFLGEFGHPLARFPRGSFDTRLNVRLPDNGWFAIGGEGPNRNANENAYQFIAMADHSVFINQMLVEPGTENLELAYRTIEFLQGPQKRTRCLFIENGTVVERFDELHQAFAQQQGIPNVNLWAIQDKITDLANALMQDVQANNVPNRIITRIFSLPAIVRFVLIVLTIYGVWYLMRRAFGARKPTDIPPPPNVAGVPAGPPGVFDRRQKELLRRNNVYEPVRDILREFFASVGVHGDQGPRLPKLVISDAVRKPESLRAAIKDFWKVAYGPPQELTVTRWREMEPYFERLRQAYTDGKWHFVFADGPVAAMA